MINVVLYWYDYLVSNKGLGGCYKTGRGRGRNDRLLKKKWLKHFFSEENSWTEIEWSDIDFRWEKSCPCCSSKVEFFYSLQWTYKNLISREHPSAKQTFIVYILRIKRIAFSLVFPGSWHTRPLNSNVVKTTRLFLHDYVTKWFQANRILMENWTWENWHHSFIRAFAQKGWSDVLCNALYFRFTYGFLSECAIKTSYVTSKR